jgi:DHA2 family methylenomycin A resistance protein-like MFS transporter
MVGAAIFTGASLLCAFAPSIGILFGGRALAGLGAALLIPASLAIIRVVWRDPVERGRALGIWAACNGLAMALGAPLGGFLIHLFGWRSIFIAVAPLSLAALALAMPSIPESSDPQNRNFDAAAQLLGAIALGSLAFAAIQSHGVPVIAVIALAAAVLALAAFVRIEAKKGAAALVPLDMFRTREFRAAIVATTGMTFGMYGALFLLPLTWQTVGRFDATAAGAALMPMALIFVVVSSFSGALAAKFGVRLMTSGGVAIIGGGLLLIGLSAHQASIVPSEIGLTLTGVGMGFATGPLMGAAVGAAGAARSGTASALINVARMAGATIGVAVLGAIFAMAHGGPDGLRLAMMLGGCVQIACAAIAWATTRPIAP